MNNFTNFLSSIYSFSISFLIEIIFKVQMITNIAKNVKIKTSVIGIKENF